MSHQPKKRRLNDNQNIEDHQVTFDALSTDELARIFEYLLAEKIMLARLNRKMRDAATKTIVPLCNTGFDNAFLVDSVRKYHALAVMTMALPNLQQIKIGSIRNNQNLESYNDGEDPEIRTRNQTTHDIGILSNFTRLRELKIDGALLNGRYPMLFNFPLLQKLHICGIYKIKWDLEMLAGLPSLKELMCRHGIVTGNIKSLRVLKGTLSKIDIGYCRDVRGDLMDFADFPKLECLTLIRCDVSADFGEISKDALPALEILQIYRCQNVRGNFMNLSHLPHLKILDLWNTEVSGDIRDIDSDDFLSLEALELSSGVYGGDGYKLQRITDAHDVIAAVSTLMKQRPNLIQRNWYAKLSNSSPDWYEPVGNVYPGIHLQPPFTIKFVKAGPRLGWRWIGDDDFDCCEINWVDPEPSKESDEYEQYIQELEGIEEGVSIYKGFYEPPTERECSRIHMEYRGGQYL